MDYIKNQMVLFFIIIVILYTGTYSSSTPETSVGDDRPRLTESGEFLQSTPTKALMKSTRTRKPTTSLQPLPMKDDKFLTIRRSKKVFIDKTPYIEKLLKDDRSCILFTRPRRFGKTNFIHMLYSFFSGEKKLFQGTYIYPIGNTITHIYPMENTDKKQGNKSNFLQTLYLFFSDVKGLFKDTPKRNTDKKGEWVQYPIINLTFSQIANYGKKVPSAELFESNLYRKLQQIADFYQVGDCEEQVIILVEKLQKKFSLPVVILIDEYDYPFTSILHKRSDGSLTKEEEVMLEGMKDTLEKFFSAIKSLIETQHVRLAFVTGVARLAFNSLPGSGPNNVVTLKDEYSCMVGFTEEEIRKYLKPHISKFAKTEHTTPKQITERLLKMYGGYLFSNTGRTKVANPVSLMECLGNEVYGNYWCELHSLHIVIDKLLAKGKRPADFKNRKVSLATLYQRNPTKNNIPTSIFMLLFGYLTIKEYNKNTKMVILDFPNDEIEETITNNFNLHQALENVDNIEEAKEDIVECLENKDLPTLISILNGLGFRTQAPKEYQFQITHEFNATAIVDLILRTQGIKTKVGQKIINIPRKNLLGDIDLHIMMEEMHYLVEDKYEKKDVFFGLEQLINYLVTNPEAVLRSLNEQRKKFKLKETDEIYLLAVNYKKHETGTTRYIHSAFGIPFQNWDPAVEKNNAVKEGTMKFWFNSMQVVGIENYYDELKHLKKLIKHEQRKKEILEQADPHCQHKKKNISGSQHPDEGRCSCDVQISSCCPDNRATVTYVHCPCKNKQQTRNECSSDSENNVLPSKNPVRSTSSLSYARNQYKNKRRKVNDPVELYHYYQSIWKQHKLPGENDHVELRQEIRNRLMNMK